MLWSSQSLLFSKLDSPSSLKPFFIAEVFQPFEPLGGLLWTCSGRSMSFIYWTPELDAVLQMGLNSRAEAETLLPLEPTLLCMQPSTCLTLWAQSSC
ncbi:hypothetical protein Nmel_007931 [Mimus melanotis]